MQEERNEPSPGFDVFISYSRREDRAFAVALQKAMEHYRPPKGIPFPRRALQVFRDESDLTGVEYHEAIKRYLAASSKVIVLCSPSARASTYVDEEIRDFVALKGKANVIPVLIGGVPNNEAKPGEDSLRAFPQALCDVQAMPLATSYVGIDLQRDKLNKKKYTGQWYTILANVLEVSRAELEERDRKRRAQRRRLIVGSTLAAVAVVAVLVSLILDQRRKKDYATIATFHRESSGLLQANKQLDAALRAIEAGLDVRRLWNTPAELRNNPIALLLEFVRRRLWNAPAELRNESIALLLEVVQSIREKNRFVGHRSFITDVAFAADGRSIASVERDGDIRFWSLDGTSAPVPKMATSCVAFSPQGDWFATGGDDRRSIRLWKSDGAAVKSIPVSSGVGTSMAVNPAGDKIAVASLNHDVGVCAVRSGECRGLGQHGGQVLKVAWSEDGRFMASLASEGVDGTVTVWREDGSEAIRLPGYTAGAFHPRDGMLALGSRSGSIEIVAWDDTGTRVLRKWPGHTGVVSTLAISPDGELLASGGRDGTVRIWNAQGKELAALKGEADITAVAFNYAGTLLLSGSGDGSVRLWAVFPRRVTTLFNQGWMPVVAVSPDAASVARSIGDRRVRVLDTREAQLYEIPTPSEVISAAFDSTGRQIAIGGANGNIFLFEISGTSPKRLRELEDYRGGNLTMVSNEKGFFVASQGGPAGVQVWGSPCDLVLWSGRDMVVATDIRSGLIATGRSDGTISFWTTKGEALRSFQEHALGSINSLAFSARNGMLISAGADGIRLWPPNAIAAGGSTLCELSRDVTAVAVSPDGTMLASSGLDGAISLWNLIGSRGIECRKLATLGMNAKYQLLAFSADGKRLIGVNESGAVTLWDLDLTKLVVQGCEWVHDYLATSGEVRESDRHLCDQVMGTKNDAGTFSSARGTP